MTLLSCRGLVVDYGVTHAVDDVNLTAYRGEVLALIGPNGAGKSSVLDAIAGTAGAGGTVILDGMRLDTLRADDRRSAGIGRVFQTPRLAGPTAADDVLLACAPPRRLLSGALRGPSRADRQRADELLDVVGLPRALRTVPVAGLGLPDRRRVELARALAGTPRLLLLDEPASGLPDEERGRFAELILALAGPDCGIVLVEHDMALVAAVAHHVVALDAGRVLCTGSYAEVATDEAVRTSYLGMPLATAPRRARTGAGAPQLRAKGIVARHGQVEVLHGVDLHAEPGEIVAVLGPNGAGKTTLARCLAGVHADHDGTIDMSGRVLPRGDARARRAVGLASVGDGRDLVPSLRVDRYLGLVLDEAGRDRAAGYFPRLRDLLGRRCGTLSGGEAQLVALARALGSAPDVLVVDELSQGLAPVALAALLPAVRDAAERGCAVVLIEQFAAAAVAIADRVLLLDGGRVTYDGSPHEAAIADGYLHHHDGSGPPPTPVLTDVTVGLQPSQRRALAAAAAATGIPPGQLVRDALDRHLAKVARRVRR